jgi:hypothetical protein
MRLEMHAKFWCGSLLETGHLEDRERDVTLVMVVELDRNLFGIVSSGEL